jgi:hypothetical protein
MVACGTCGTLSLSRVRFSSLVRVHVLHAPQVEHNFLLHVSVLNIDKEIYLV